MRWKSREARFGTGDCRDVRILSGGNNRHSGSDRADFREADLALLRGDLSSLKRPTLKIDARKDAAISGQSLISLGYATGISAILARAGDETVDQI